jgi:hypothetical protein
VFLLDLIFRNMVHVDSNDSANGGVVEGRYSSAEFHIECPSGKRIYCKWCSGKRCILHCF